MVYLIVFCCALSRMCLAGSDVTFYHAITRNGIILVFSHDLWHSGCGEQINIDDNSIYKSTTRSS